MEALYAGLDVGSTFMHLVAVTDTGEVAFDRRFATDREKLCEVIDSLSGEVQVHVEASTLAGCIRRLLLTRANVKRVVVGHPKSSAWIAKDPLKNDRLDALKLAQLLRMGQVHEVYYPNEAHRETFKRIVQNSDRITGQVVRIKNQIKARFWAEGVWVQGNDLYGVRGRGSHVAQVSSAAAREDLQHQYELLDETVKIQKKARALMMKEGKKYPEVARFQEVPGIGPVGACRFSAYIQTPERFHRKQQVWRYCRLGITDRSSDGKPLGRQRLDRNGHGRLKDVTRKAFEAARRTRKENQFQRTYREALSRTQNKTHARLTTQRKFVTVLWAMWKGDTRYQDDKG